VQRQHVLTEQPLEPARVVPVLVDRIRGEGRAADWIEPQPPDAAKTASTGYDVLPRVSSVASAPGDQKSSCDGSKVSAVLVISAPSVATLNNRRSARAPSSVRRSSIS
jgi:hypothetical protein